MRRQRTIILLALCAFLALGLVRGDLDDDGGAVEAQDSEGDEPSNVECDDSTDGNCTDARGSGGGVLEEHCFCLAPYSDPPGELRHAEPYRAWLACAEACAEEIRNHDATPDPEFIGTAPLRITRNDGQQLEGVCGWDNILGIQGWHLTSDADDRIAKFNKMAMSGPSWATQSIYFKINDVDAFEVSWTGKKSGPVLDAMIIAALRSHGFEVDETEDFILVLSAPDGGASGGTGIKDFTIRYTSGTKLNELYVALEPLNFENRLYCLTGGPGGGSQ